VSGDKNMQDEFGATSFQQECAAPLDCGARDPDATPQWYAAYTRANHEKCTAEQLEQREIEHFLPLYETVHNWKDRRKRLEFPLFPGYLFVRIALQNRLAILQVPGVACLVGFAGRPAPVREEEFAKIRGFLKQGLRAEPHPYLRVGRRVQVRSGPLQGMTGIILRRKSSCRLVISLELIQRAMAVDIDSGDVEGLP
jgi:transcriptional antiterminator NusG